MTRRRRLAVVLAVAVVVPLLAGCRDRGRGEDQGDLLVVVSAPLTTAPWLGELTAQGAQLAAEQLNAAGGVKLGAGRARIRIEVLDHANSATTAQANARRAVAQNAAALITDGVGALGVASVTDAARLPVFVTYEGGGSIIDAKARPTLFRMAPANRPMSRRLADYLAGRTRAVALLSDDSTYGREGVTAMRDAFARNEIPIAAGVEVPSGAVDVSTQVRAARESRASALVVWARAPVVAAVVRAARSRGWTVPIYTGPTGEDPLVRQQLADRPQWVDGLTFVSFRITAEIGPEPFQAFRTAYEKRFGVENVGVTADGRAVVQPPDWATYPYDAVRLLAASLEHAGTRGQRVLDALHAVSITGANGDERSFTLNNHEGVSPDDMYFARFRGMRFSPVTDDFLSKDLPPVPQ